MRAAIVLCASLTLTITPFAAGQQQQQPYSESVEVRIHSLDVIVTDKNGDAVKGLTKNDFVITEAGAGQEITNFAVYDDTVVSNPTIADSEQAGATVVSAPPPRRYVFFIDDMAIQTNARNTLKKHVSDLIATMRPGDVAAIVRPMGAARMVQEYTGDPAEVERNLHKVIDSCRVKITNQSFAELQTFRRSMERAESPNEIAAAKRLYVDMTRGRVEQRIGQIRALTASMAGTDGKKILVVITSGLSVEPGREAYGLDEQLAIFETPRDQQSPDELVGMLVAQDLQVRRLAGRMAGLRNDVQTWTPRARWQGSNRVESVSLRSQIDDLARTAAADGVTIYALEPEVPNIMAVTRGADSRTMGSTLVTSNVSANEVLPSQMLNDLLHYGGETLTSLTEKTGGRWFRGPAGIDDTFRQISEDLHFYYSLAYRPSAVADKARKVKVAVKGRPELKVRTRTEVLDRPAERDMSGRVIAALLYPTDVNDLKMTVSAESPAKQGKAFLVPVEVVIPADRITFLRTQDGGYRAMVSVHYALSRDEKELVSYGKQDQVIELTPLQYAEMLRIRYRYTSTITAPKGKLRLVFGVVDTVSKQASLQTLSLTTK
jgi:VWFA-related protein